MEWFPWYPARYKDKTLHLTAEQDGIYRRLIDHYMETRRPLPDSNLALARISGVTLECFEHANSIIRAFFKHGKDGVLTHQTCDEMLNEQDGKAKFRTDRAKKAAEKRWSNQTVTGLSNATSMPIAMLGDATVNSNSNSRDISPKGDIPPTPKGRVVGYPPHFEIFWETYPNRTGKAAAYKAYQAAIKQHGVTHEQLLDRAGQFAAAHKTANTPAQYICHPTTWLNGGRWEDDLSRITARSNGAPPAANARGSQFNAVQSALAKLIAEDQQDVSHGQAGLSERGMGSPFDIQLTREPEPKRLQISVDRDNTASGQIIDHDAAIPNHE